MCLIRNKFIFLSRLNSLQNKNDMTGTLIKWEGLTKFIQLSYSWLFVAIVF